MALRAAQSHCSTEALYREHGAAVAALCRSLLRDRAETEDATQQVFLSAHRALLNGAAPREPLAWLLAVARNECYARFRQRAVAPVPAGEAPEAATADASVHVLRAGELADVWDEIGQMPPAQREAFLLREIRGLSYGQLADELSLSPPSVRSLLLRARARLRHRLRDVAALGGAPWVQGLVRLVGGGDGASPVPAATKAAAVGLGALALVSGGDVPRSVHHATTSPSPATLRRPADAHVREISAPAAVVAAPREDRVGTEDRSSGPEGARGREDGSGHSGRSGSPEGTSSGEGSRGAGDGGGGTVAVAQPTTDGHDAGGSSSSGSDGGSVTTTASSGSDGSGSGSGSGSSGSSGSDSSGGSHDLGSGDDGSGG